MSAPLPNPTEATQSDFLTVIASLPATGEKMLLGKQVKLHDGTVGYVPTAALPPNAALYVNTGSFIKARMTDKDRALKENIEHCLFIMLDDVGTKVDPTRLTVTPTWKIETSPGNYQWGYAYSERPTKIEQSAALVALGKAGLNDPEATNPVRWARIPGSVHKIKGSVSRLAEFNPEARVTLPELLQALGVSLDRPAAIPDWLEPPSEAADPLPVDLVKLRGAMLAIDPDCARGEWVAVGMAWCIEGGDFNSWDQWSAKGSKYPGTVETAKQWESFDTEKKEGVEQVRAGTLYKIAGQHGWTEPLEFKPVKRKTLMSFSLTDKIMENVKAASFLVPNLIVEGSVTALVAETGGGKTAITTHFANKIAATHEAIYINMDASPAQLADQFEQAKRHGWTIIAPDMAGEGGIKAMLEALQEMSTSNEPLTDKVFIVDTLKKVAEMLNKDSIKAFIMLCRRLVAKGATVVLLAHTNKYPDSNGKLIFEGVGDLRSDVDNMIYLYSSIASEGVREVTTAPDKVRAYIKPRSFRIHMLAGITVEECELLHPMTQFDRKILTHALEFINELGALRKELVDYLVSATGHGINKVGDALIRLTDGDTAPLVLKGDRGMAHRYYKK